MNKIIQNFGLQPADRIVIPKSFWNLVQHHAIYLGYDHMGEDWIIENKDGIGVRLITASQFFAAAPLITRIEKFRGNDDERKHAVQRALKNAGKPYNLINYNCEHFANEVQNGIATSKQIVIGAAFVFAAVFLAANARK